MKVFYYFLILSLSSAVNSFGQTNFVKGYYVTFDSDTVHGLIEYRSDNRNSRICTFKNSTNGVTTQFNPSEIYSYALEDKIIFKSCLIQKESETQELFLKILVSGSVSFFKGTGDTYYLETNENQKVELSKRKKIIVLNNKYIKGYLKALMAEQPELIHKIDNSDYSLDFVKNLIAEYNQLPGNEHHFIAKNTSIDIRPDFSFGLVQSSQHSRLRIQDPTIELEDFGYSWSIAGGVIGQLFVPRVDESLKLTYQLLFDKNSFFSSYSTTITNSDIFLTYSGVTNALMVQKELTNPFKLFVEGGIQQKFTFSKSMSWRQEQLIGNGIYTQYMDRQHPVSPFYFGYLLGVGKKFPIGESMYLSSAIRYAKLNNVDRNFYPSFLNVTELQITIVYK